MDNIRISAIIMIYSKWCACKNTSSWDQMGDFEEVLILQFIYSSPVSLVSFFMVQEEKKTHLSLSSAFKFLMEAQWIL